MDYKTAKGMLRDDERRFLADLGLALPHEAIINIGVEYGASMVCLAEKYRGQLLIGIDISMIHLANNVQSDLAEKAMWMMGDSHEKVTIDRIKGLLIRADGAEVSILFIDGDHTYEGVLADANDYTPLVRYGGLAIFHDCFDYDHPETGLPNPNAPYVNEAVDDWYEADRANWGEIDSVGTMRIFRRRFP